MIHIGLRNQKKSPHEVIKYIKNNTPIPIEIFYKYNNEYACKHKVSFKCKICDIESIDSWDNLNNRIKLYNNVCCKKCSYIYSTCLRENIPSELIPYYFNNSLVPFELYLKYKDYNANKLYISCNCEKCNSKTKVKWGKIKNRQHSSVKQICNKCVQKYTSNLEIVKKRNSDSQLIAQNRPESKEKQRIAQIKRCKERPQSIEKQRIAIKRFFNTKQGLELKNQISKRTIRLWTTNEEYRMKCTSKTNHLTGRYNGIYFDSSWELSILVYYEKDNIKRAKFNIPYVYNNKKHRYFPDFILNDSIILEIKGIRNKINEIKEKATIEYLKRNNINMQYKILYRDELEQLENFIFYDNIKKLSLLDKNKLIITNYPKSWKK